MRFLPLLVLGLAVVTPALGQVVGPFVGQVSSSDARFLYRTDSTQKTLRVSVLDGTGAVVASDTQPTVAGSDYTAHFHVQGLASSTTYNYRVDEIESDNSAVLLAGNDGLHHFRTFPGLGERTVFTAAFLSCANSTTEPAWACIDSLNVDGLFLMGDTPYIDSSVLATVRQSDRNFLLTPAMNTLVRHVPTAATWDDHDFGLNNGNGISVTGKAVNRQVFVEYRANAQFGNGTAGVYDNVPCGPMEVFLIDDRWFTQTAASPIDPTQPTFFGAAQWTWLTNALKQSRAPFKIVSAGCVWQDKKNTENDDMQTYWYERDALFDFIRDQKIPGVVILGGDIHVSRHLIHPQRLGYDLHDIVSSPGHTSVIPSLDVYNPDLEWSSEQPQQFVTIKADTRVQPAVLTIKFYLKDGTVQRTVTIPYDQLVPKTGTGLAKDLRGYWPFDGDLKNRTVLGSRIDAAAVGGASAGTNDGVHGGAASLARASNQYLKIGRSILPENSAQFTVSTWIKPVSLPAHNSTDRAFILESTPTGDITTTDTGYGVSAGFGTGATADTVGLSLYTYTFKPAVASSNGTNSPTDLAQGPFTVQVSRSLLLNQWTHVAFTFDSTRFKLYLNGALAATLPLTTPGPLAETGGLVVGGHRGGTGRNFDGQLDELAIWSRALSDAEVATLWGGGTAAPLPTATAAVDSDGDGLPDWWEITNGLDPLNPADAVSDTDGDGVPAFVEYAMGTSPLHDDRKFYQYVRQIAAPSRAADATGFRDPSSGGVNVKLTLEVSTDMTHWSPLPLNSAGVGIEALDGLLKLKVPPAAGQMHYYRFQVKAPTTIGTP